MSQKSLFDQLGMVTAPQAKELLADVYPLLWHSIHEPWAEFQDYRRVDPRFRDLTEGQAAWWLHIQVTRMAQLLASDSPSFGVTANRNQHGQFFLNFRGEAVLVFKKLTRRWSQKHGRFMLERSNYLTQHNQDFWQQRKEDGAPDAPRFIIGYEPIKELTDVKVFVGYPRTHGKRFTWIYPMPEQIDAEKWFIKPAPIAPAPAGDEAGFVVKPRKSSEEDERGAV